MRVVLERLNKETVTSAWRRANGWDQPTAVDRTHRDGASYASHLEDGTFNLHRVINVLYESQATRHPRMSLAGVQIFEKTWIPAKSTRE